MCNIIRNVMLDTYRFLVNSILSKNKDLYCQIKLALLYGIDVILF